jgi:hypothetical protein
MNQTQTFQDFLATHAGEVDLSGLALNILMAAVLCATLAWFYVRYGTTLSNRRTLAKTFLLVGVTTTLIITVVKSSLALSLGLVGALSIVRFRAAIKEPEELGYLFLTIAVGLGFGADQRAVTVVAFSLILGLIFLYRTYASSGAEQNSLFLKIRTRPDSAAIDIEALAGEVTRSCSSSSLRRFEELADGAEAVFSVVVDDFAQFVALRDGLRSQHADLDLTFVEDVRLT